MKTMKTLTGLTALFTASAAFAFLVAPQLQPSVVEGLPMPNGPQSTASWISSAETVAEQALEADTIVRVQVVERKEAHTISALRISNDSLDNLAATVSKRGLEEPVIPFTNTTLEILEVYSGKVAVGDRVEILQTGGEIDGLVAEVYSDPLLEVGSEQVLFLANISGDSLHATKDTALFRTLNPASRYQVHGTQLQSIHSSSKGVLPGDLATLEAEITTALASLKGESLSNPILDD